MTLEEVYHLSNCSKLDIMWKKAFNEYNKENSIKLSMQCKPCYQKVMDWHLNKLMGRNTNMSAN